MKHYKLRRSLFVSTLGLAMGLANVGIGNALGSSNPQQSGSTGLQGTIGAPAPATAPTISVPVNGRSFSTTPVTVSGLCASGLLVKVFSNNVFAGSVQCSGDSFSLQVDLFTGQNDLVAQQYDALDQASPASNTVSDTFSGAQLSTFAPRVSLTSQYAKLGADTGTQLTWPLVLSGGSGPYAISVDWGDGSTPELLSESFPGQFNIVHTYDSSGVYRVIVRAGDNTGQIAFLQLVGVGNGKVTQSTEGGGSAGGTSAGGSSSKRSIIWWPFVAFFPLVAIAFFLGQKYELQEIHKQLERNSQG